jgi:hypothetical protein
MKSIESKIKSPLGLYCRTEPSSSSLNNLDNLEARLRFVAGETPCAPIIDSSTACESSLFSITAASTSGMDPSLEKLICSKLANIFFN